MSFDRLKLFFCASDRPPTFQYQNVLLLDVDECAVATDNNCNANGFCRNIDGSFSCFCNVGFVGDGITCTCEFILLLKY